MRPTVAVSLVFASMTGLLACPQLLSDDFDAALSTDDDSCARRLTCAGGAGGSGGTTGGTGGSPPGAGGSTPNAGDSGSAGAAGTGGSGDSGGSGEPGTGGSGGSAGGGGSGGGDPPDASVEPPEPNPACWLVELDDDTHVASGNCLGINGWNQVVTDGTTDTVVNLSYDEDRVCFTGTIVNEGWGATYNFTLNDEAPWGSDALAVGGFQLEAVGSALPPQLKVIYTDDDDGDFCRFITPGAAVQVPFASAHPDCSTSSSSVPDPVDLTYIRLVMPPAASDYAIDFCLGIRAIP